MTPAVGSTMGAAADSVLNDSSALATVATLFVAETRKWYAVFAESPEIGADTVFHSMTAAYESLSDRLQQFISGLEAVHDFKPFKALFAESEEGWRKLRQFEEIYRPVTHPVVRVHPVSGKKALYVNPQFTLFIKGMEERESRTLLDTLFRATSVLEHQYRHRWEPNTVVFWDNRAAQHAAVHDYYPQRRLMERVTIRGDRPFGPG